MLKAGRVHFDGNFFYSVRRISVYARTLANQLDNLLPLEFLGAYELWMKWWELSWCQLYDIEWRSCANAVCSYDNYDVWRLPSKNIIHF